MHISPRVKGVGLVPVLSVLVQSSDGTAQRHLAGALRGFQLLEVGHRLDRDRDSHRLAVLPDRDVLLSALDLSRQVGKFLPRLQHVYLDLSVPDNTSETGTSV